MDSCHLKNAELAKHHQTYTSRELCSGVTTSKTKKDTEQYSEARASASQMAVAKFLDTISMLPGVTGETRDAILACTQVKMIEAPRLSRSVSKWNKACDSRLPSLSNYINQTKNYKQPLYSRIRLRVVNLVSFKMLQLQAACGIQKSTSGTLRTNLDPHTFVPFS